MCVLCTIVILGLSFHAEGIWVLTASLYRVKNSVAGVGGRREVFAVDLVAGGLDERLGG